MDFKNLSGIKPYSYTNCANLTSGIKDWPINTITLMIISRTVVKGSRLLGMVSLNGIMTIFPLLLLNIHFYTTIFMNCFQSYSLKTPKSNFNYQWLCVKLIMTTRRTNYSTKGEPISIKIIFCLKESPLQASSFVNCDA